MATVEAVTRRLETVFERRQADVLAEVITDAYSDLVKTGDFNELKEIVRRLASAQERTEARVTDLAEAQQRTEARMTDLAEAQQRTEARMTDLAEAQRRTDDRLVEFELRVDQRIVELVEAQQRTEARVTDLAEAQRRTDDRLAEFELRVDQRFVELADAMAQLARTVNGMGQELGGLSRSMSYALENEAYRMLPELLAERFGISLQERLVRTEVDGEEINLFAHGQRNGQPVIVVGETKLQLDERRSNRRASDEIFRQVDAKAAAVRRLHPNIEIVRILLTHYARPSFLQQAQEHGVLVIQSYEW
jgi:hypothetical protein